MMKGNGVKRHRRSRDQDGPTFDQTIRQTDGLSTYRASRHRLEGRLASELLADLQHDESTARGINGSRAHCRSRLRSLQRRAKADSVPNQRELRVRLRSGNIA